MNATDSHPPTPLPQIIAAYEWTTGRACYRCSRKDVDTAPIGALSQRGGSVQVPACPSCVVVLERQREEQAIRFGWPYRPGTPVDCPDH